MAIDPHAAVFRDAGPADWTSDDLIAGLLDRGLLEDTTDHPIADNPDGWDDERTGPKTIDEARAQLAARVADPTAPDNDATAYDELTF